MAKRQSPTPPKNPFAKALSSGLFQQKKVRAKKGKGAYIRRQKHQKSLPAAFDVLPHAVCAI
ncbi:hypothetical protein GCM10017044_11620 [Kordiimonas sediminis]|uniref:Ribosome alternative rescue factor ArfA n=1 Tax=Kordiimonas sediminis TaxID=1735581 RepID=A0A919E717_9PROT|nr:alternative ribosome rescue factor ArfA [Kordiimonas sediminis]GHF18757.1 hypothetical protein GCM10017044_11620 [Kordiimonas sediminis]